MDNRRSQLVPVDTQPSELAADESVVTARLTELMAAHPVESLIVSGGEDTFNRFLWEVVGDPHSERREHQPLGIYRIAGDDEQAPKLVHEKREVASYSELGTLLVVRRDPSVYADINHTELEPAAYTVTSADLLDGTITDWHVVEARRVFKGSSPSIRGIRELEAVELYLEDAALADVVPLEAEEMADATPLQRAIAHVQAKIAAEKSHAPRPSVRITSSNGVIFSPDGVRQETMAGPITELVSRLDAFREEVRCTDVVTHGSLGSVALLRHAE